MLAELKDEFLDQGPDDRDAPYGVECSRTPRPGSLEPHAEAVGPLLVMRWGHDVER